MKSLFAAPSPTRLVAARRRALRPASICAAALGVALGGFGAFEITSTPSGAPVALQMRLATPTAEARPVGVARRTTRRTTRRHVAHGSGSYSASGGCGGGSCSREVTRTGPYGYSVSKQREGSCANGTCSGSKTVTGPVGGSVTREGSISRY